MAYLQRFLVCCFFLLLSACGGGGGGSAAPGSGSGTGVPTPAPVTPPPAEVRLTKVTLQSDSGDAIGLGKNYSYNLSDAKISVTNERNQLVVRVEGDETWTGVFQTGGPEQTLITTGMVANAPRYEEGQDWGRSGLAWFGEGRACSSSYGWFSVDNVKYQGPRVTEIKVRFERHCNGTAAALHGEITYYADDTTKPPPPVLPAPANLWRPADLGNTIGNYAYFESEEGDYVGLGKTYRYDQRSANIKVYGATNDLVISVEGNEIWSGELRAMDAATDLQPGYYPAVHGSRFNNPVKGGVSWTGAGRGCSRSTGWFVVDSVTVANYRVTALDLRFEQHCEGRAAALRGVIHWKDPALMDLPPAANTAVGSWRAPAVALPASGNYLYMQGDIGDSLANGLIDLQTSANASFDVGVQDNRLSFNVHGVHNWSGTLMPKPGQAQFAPGDYASLSKGAFTIALDHYGYFDPLGWVVIDNISYVGGKIVALDLRLEALSINSMGNGKGLLRGQLHWRADQPDNFPGPSQLVPALFWRPATNYLPTAGNYIYLESDRSDFLGAAPAYLYTPLDSMITVSADRNKVSVNVNGDERWSGSFATMSNASQILAGYYAGLENTEFSNPARGYFSWGGDGRGCNTATSGVVIDKAVYSGSQLVELLMRFEQHCDNGAGAMRGEIRWSAYDTQQPAGPAPIPADLWRAPVATLPASGNYLYVQSDAGDPIGGGKAWLMTAQDTKFMASSTPWIGIEAYFSLSAESTNKSVGYWSGDFQAMVGVKKFQVGLYDRVMRFPFQNTAFGGLNWDANGVGCNRSGGWFAVDKAVYSGDTLVALHARFEQHCEFQVSALRGELNWEAPAKTLSVMKAVLPGGSLSETASRKKWGLKERSGYPQP